MANRAPRIDIPDDDALAPGEALLELPLSDESAGRVVVRWDGGDIELTAARYGLLIAGMDDGGELRAFAMRIPFKPS